MNTLDTQNAKVTNNKAIASLVIGIVGAKEAKHLNQKGKRMAVAGIICSSVGILLPILLFIIAYITFLSIK